MKKKPIPAPVQPVVIRQSIEFLKSIVLILEYQSKPSIANQGQCLDGYSALANYNSIAEMIREFLKRNYL